MTVYWHTDIGLKRNENQDCADWLVLPNALFAVVCDGMGGSRGGKEASSQVCSIIKDRVEKCWRPDYDSNKIRNLLISSVGTANAVVHDLGSAVPEWRGMGTTCVAAIIKDDTLHIVNVGDSRGYLIRHEITQITRDHSKVMELFASGAITREELRSHPERNIITRAVGVDTYVETDYFECQLDKGDAVLLCTDGLSNYCDEGRIFRIVKECDPENVPRSLIDEALKNGGSDNITALIIK